MRTPPPRHRPRPRLAPAPLPRRAPPPGATAASCHRAPPHRVARTAPTNTAALLAHTHREPRAAPPRHHRHRAAAPPRRGERRPPGMPRRSRRRPSCARCSSQQLQWVPDGRDGINGRGHPPGSRRPFFEAFLCGRTRPDSGALRDAGPGASAGNSQRQRCLGEHTSAASSGCHARTAAANRAGGTAGALRAMHRVAHARRRRTVRVRQGIVRAPS